MTDITLEPGDTVETPFGPLAWRPEAELAFPSGLPGFGGVTRFLLGPIPGHEGPFQVLHGLVDEPLNLVVVPMDCLAERIDASDIEAVRAKLEIPAEDLLVLCIVTLPRRDQAGAAQVNARAPIFVDVGRRLGVQMVLPSAGYRFRAPLVAA